MRPWTLLAGATALVAIGASTFTGAPWVVWNATASVPVGFYRIDGREPQRGDLALIRLSGSMSRLASDRGYLLSSVLLLKPIAAMTGDRVCRVGGAIVIGGRVAAWAKSLDARGRDLPVWRGCRVLTAGQVFVLAVAQDSFDSRYFGPVDADSVVGRAHPVWTFE